MGKNDRIAELLEVALVNKIICIDDDSDCFNNDSGCTDEATLPSFQLHINSVANCKRLYDFPIVNNTIKRALFCFQY